ncbi:MAG TPA: HEAT repeat domain-containing protein [Pirellulaceae bacterium]|nr:HEAT repeat domain-containing protein [Pirellulaceae bacterium]
MMTTRCSIWQVALLAILWGGFTASASAQNNPFVAREADLIEVLKSGERPDKALACKQLAIYGTDKAVPELAKLLSDPELASWARIALEAIPGPAPDEALTKAAGSLEGRLLVGTINSLGVRQAASAVEPLTARLADKDALVASAAALALGRIGGEAATKTLRQALAGDRAEVRSAVAEGCILCAERLLAADKSDEAVAIYDEVRQAEVAKPRKLEATRGAILARKSAGIPLLVEHLQSPDKQFMQIALSAARELPGSEVDEALATELTKIPAERAALVLYALADRKLKSVPAAVLAAAKSGDKGVRIAAIEFIGRLGNESSIDTLVGVATESDAELSQAARKSLADLRGDKVNAEIAARLDKAEGKVLSVLIETVGQRRIDATAALKKALDHSDKSVRSAALKALGETVAAQDLSVLISQVVAAKDAELAEVAHKALTAASVRMPDRDACAAVLTAAMQRAPAATRPKLLETIGAIGGKKSLETIASALKGSNEELKDAGSRILGEWMSVDAAPVLLEVAKDDKAGRYQVRALRGYIRLVRQFPVSDQQRGEMCQSALDAATRIEEQKLVMQVLERYPSVDTLRVTVKAAAIPALKDDAGRVALVIAQKIGGQSADVQDLLKKVGIEPVKVEIVKAVYGASGQQKDVTELLQKQAGTSPLIVLGKPTYNEAFGGDPAPSVKKVLHVQYKLNGQAGEASFEENASILLPMPK